MSAFVKPTTYAVIGAAPATNIAIVYASKKVNPACQLTLLYVRSAK